MIEYNPFSLESKRILVTGASSGIGSMTALECAKLGASIIVTGRNVERLTTVFNDLDVSSNQQHQMIVADLSTPEGVDAIVSACDFLDGFVSNAGIAIGVSPVRFMKDADLDRLIELNLKSHVKLARNLYKKKKLNKGASCVFTSSIGGVLSFGIGSSIYGMTKAAISSFSKFCAVEFASRGIRCNAVCPGMIETPLTANMDNLSAEDIEINKRYGKPEEVARPIAFLLSDASSFITGISLVIDGGVTIPIY